MATTTTTTAAAAVQIKVRHGDDVRRFALELEKFSKLEKRVLRCYGLEAAPRGSHVIKYTDDEGDACSITNDDELAVALKGVADDQARGLTGVLRLAVVATAGAPAQEPAAGLEPFAVLLQAGVPACAVRHAMEVAGFDDGALLDDAQPEDGAQPAWRRGRGHHGGKAEHRHRHGEPPHHEHRRRCAQGQMTRKCKARFVSDVTCADGAVFEAGAPIVKTWRILNAGRDAWPEGTMLLRVGGDDVLPAGAPQAVAVAPAAAGEHVDVSAELLAPEASGRYVSYWRLQGKDGNRFGQRFWCMFHVVDGAAEAEAEALPDQDELVQEAEAVEAVLEAGLSALQARAVMQAFRRRVHLGIVCDVTGSAPIIGVRHTRRNANGDSYDVCEAGLGQLPEEERAGLTAMPRPDVKALIRTVLAKGERFGFAQAASHAAAELEPPAVATAAEEQLAAEEQAAKAVLQAKLNAVQATAVMAAFRDGVHLGITCDVTGQSPITGTRYTRPTGDDTYDVSEAAFGALPEAERAALTALPRPDVHLLIKHVLGAEAAALAEAETRAAEDAAAAEAEAAALLAELKKFNARDRFQKDTAGIMLAVKQLFVLAKTPGAWRPYDETTGAPATEGCQQTEGAGHGCASPAPRSGTHPHVAETIDLGDVD